MCSLLTVMVALMTTLSGYEGKIKELEEIVCLEESQITDFFKSRRN